MAWVGHVGIDLIIMIVSLVGALLSGYRLKVWTYAAVSAVCSATLFRCLVDLDVLDNKISSVKTLGVRIGFGVLQEREEVLGRLDGPAGTGDTELFA